jgi:hypothetical protein
MGIYNEITFAVGSTIRFAIGKGEEMKRKKSNNVDRKYAKPVSLYPLKPEEALSAFMKVNPKKIVSNKRKDKK